MLTILRNPEILQNIKTDKIATTHLINGNNLIFYFNGYNILFEAFNLTVIRAENGKLLNINIELSSNSAEKLSKISSLFKFDLSRNDFSKNDKLILKFNLKADILERFASQVLNKFNNFIDLFKIEDNSGTKVLLNLNNFTVQKIIEC